MAGARANLPATSENRKDPGPSFLDRLLPRHEKRIAKKLVRSWFIQGVGWYALTEIAARAIVEGAFVLVLTFLGWPLVAIVVAAVLFHTLIWFVLYGGFMRLWIVLGFTKDLAVLRAHVERLEARAKRQPYFQLMFVRGSTARGQMSPTSDIDIIMAPRPGIRAHVLGILFLWGLRVESLARRIPVEARWIDAERYAPYHHIGETPLVVYRDETVRRTVGQRLASRGLLIAVSGLDGSGKTSVARRMLKKLEAAGYRGVYVWGHRQAWLVQEEGPDISLGILYESLWKRIGRPIADFGKHPFAKFFYDLFTALDYLYIRWKLSALLKPNTIVLTDRYVADVLAYLRSWGPLKTTIEGFLLAVSYEPDLAILFDIDAETARMRKQENPIAQLRRFSREYATLTPLLRLETVDARGALDSVTAQVESLVEKRLGIALPQT